MSLEAFNGAVCELDDSFVQSVLESFQDAVSINIGTTRVFVNAAYLRLYGLQDKSEAIGHEVDENISDEDRTPIKVRVLARQRGDWDGISAHSIIRKDGEVRHLEVSGTRVRYKDQLASLAIMRDVTERVRVEKQLELTVSLLTATLDAAPDGILALDMQNRVITYNRPYTEIWKLPEDFQSAIEKDGLSLYASQMADPEAFLARISEVKDRPGEVLRDVLQFKDGRIIERQSRPQRLGDEIVGRVLSFRDVTERELLEDSLRHQATHDPLTDLLNRRGLENQVEEALRSDDGVHSLGALVILDIDQFKDINDRLGHVTGDRVLVAMAELLKGQLGPDAVLARLGGDEFAAMFLDTTKTEATYRANQALQAVAEYRFATREGSELGLTTSAGMAFFPDHAHSFHDLLARADIALYRSKELGRNCLTVFEPVERKEAEAGLRLDLRSKIHDALREDRFVLYAQPIVSLQGAQEKHHELLLRMRLPEGKVLSAGAFIHLAERCGLIRSIDRWVSRQAIQLAAARQSQERDLVFEVNLSRSALSDDGLLRAIREDIEGCHVDPAGLVFEVTETAAISNLSAAREFIANLKGLGCRFALDDFGVGYSSFSQLKSLPVDFLKIDGSFIRGVTQSDVDQKLVKAMVGLGDALGMQTVAEFVGDEETLLLLKELGVGFGQGYYLGRPQPAARLAQGPRHLSDTAA